MAYAGANWLKGYIEKDLSPFGEDVANLLGEWAGGIYHLSNSLPRVDWKNNYSININVRNDLDTFDNGNLTKLVFLAHWFCIRVEITSCTRGLLKLCFSRRVRNGDLYSRHPTLAEAVGKFEKMMEQDGVAEYQDVETEEAGL